MSDLRFNTGAPERQVTASADFSESFDARDWAKAFVEHVTANPAIAADEGTMLAWFANALMRGYDEREKRLRRAAARILLRLVIQPIDDMPGFAYEVFWIDADGDATSIEVRDLGEAIAAVRDAFAPRPAGDRA